MRSLAALLCLAHGAAAFNKPQAAGLCDPGVKQYSGYIDLSTGAKHLFYWAFESRNDPATDPVILWMTGGPGCSSAVALFGENGPCKVNADGTATKLNPYSWNRNATLIYVDQPAGTGFSYGAKDSTEAGVARDMVDFLVQWFRIHGKFSNHDLYVTGESYAGHYVPAVSSGLFRNGTLRRNLKGLAIGNGLTDPEVQFAYYKDMIVSTNHHKPAVGKVVHAAMSAATPVCVGAIKACKVFGSVACLGATTICNLGLLIPYQLTGMNPYDMRIKCKKPPLCYDFSNVGTYLNRPEVRAALGVGHHRWTDCNRLVAIGFKLGGDWMRSYENKIPDQLNDGIRVLIYAGDQDYICNWLGNQAWTQALELDASPGKPHSTVHADLHLSQP